VDITILASGSSGNVTILKSEKSIFMIDCGLGRKELEKRMILSDINDRPDAVFITHSHNDHVKGLVSLQNICSCPVFSFADLDNVDKLVNIEIDKIYRFKDAKFMAFKTLHDTKSSGFYFQIGTESVMILTDTGDFTQQMAGLARDCDYLLLESNYDEQMLNSSSYPDFLKKRIISDRGHLSNTRSYDFLSAVLKGSHRLKEVYLCHLSENNNSISLVEEMFAPLRGKIKLYVCPHGELMQMKKEV